jgi:hypothetical protein
MNGQFLRSLDKKLVDRELPYRWLKFGDIKGETGSENSGSSGSDTHANCFKEAILKEKFESKCQLCK